MVEPDWQAAPEGDVHVRASLRVPERAHRRQPWFREASRRPGILPAIESAVTGVGAAVVNWLQGSAHVTTSEEKTGKSAEVEKDELLDLAYDAAKSRLASQTAAFEGFRTRASGILAVAALVTSFSAGLGLVNTDSAKGPVLPSWAPWVLLGILLVVGVLAFAILLPTRKWVHGPSAGAILQLREEANTPEQGKLVAVQAMVEAQQRNSQLLTIRAWAYRAAVLCLLFEILVLVAAVAEGRAEHNDRPKAPAKASSEPWVGRTFEAPVP
ncbi:hypothetical protein ACFYSF_22260 [Streptomyces canus]|uniref:hypothetical protein n=1 Tax=Streptomyces canus TaxID=58343 RepID=UPI00369D9879